MAVHVSIHDVSPVWRDEVERALDLCDAVGARPALLVVPDFHGRAPLLADPAFCDRLRRRQANGHEVYLHGFSHRSEPRRRPDSSRLAWFLAQRVFSQGEAEMSGLSLGEGRRRLEDGERTLQSAGLRIDGFVPPAWSMPTWMLPLLEVRGYRFSEDRLRVYDPAARRARLSVVLNWASRSPGRLLSTVAFCRLARHARAALPARIAIHPADLGFVLLRREIARLLEWARGDFVARGCDLLSLPTRVGQPQ
jgi:predicted deacetylase